MRCFFFWKYVIAVVVILGCAVHVSRQYQSASDECGQLCTQINDGDISSPHHGQGCDECTEHAITVFPRWYRLFSWPEGITAWAIILTLIVIAEQTMQTRNAAESALLNAKALVNSERPWLIAEVVRGSQMPHFYEIQITNYGRTPARFLNGDASYLFAERPDLLSVPPNYSSPFVLPKQLLIAPGKGFPIPHGYNVPHLLQKPAAANKTLVIYGRVLYEDTIIPGVEHETRWCFGYIDVARGQTMGGDFMLTGPNEYTRNG
jgi:hypothetical protein